MRPKNRRSWQLDEKVERIDEEIQRLRAATRRLKPGRKLARLGAIEIFRAASGVIARNAGSVLMYVHGRITAAS